MHTSVTRDNIWAFERGSNMRMENISTSDELDNLYPSNNFIKKMKISRIR
jgi:hypothetical protein